MINLQSTSGLPLEATEDLKLKFSQPLPEVVPNPRKFVDMQAVWMDQSVKVENPEQVMYDMYRDIHFPEHEDLLRQNHLRYDVTFINSFMVGQEYNKTLGHYHALVPGQTVAYPEMYEVLNGEALFLIQKVDESGNRIEDFQIIKAQVGDKVIYPPGYGHIIVNVGKGPLITANWVADNFESIYQPIIDHKGMGYYVIQALGKPYLLIENTHYSKHAPIKWVWNEDKIENEFGFTKSEPMYLTGIKNPEKLKFLTHPQDFQTQLAKLVE